MKSVGISHNFIKVVIRIFTLAFTVCEILTFQFFYFQKVGQGHGAIFLQCESRAMDFYASCNHSETLKFRILIIKIGQDHAVKFLQLDHSMAKSTKVVPCIFCTSSNRFGDITFQMFNFKKVGQGHVI